MRRREGHHGPIMKESRRRHRRLHPVVKAFVEVVAVLHGLLPGHRERALKLVCKFFEDER